MAGYVHFYTIGFFDQDGNGVDRDVVVFLGKIEELLKAKDTRVIRTINEEIFRIFLYSRNQMDDDILVVPLGKPIKKNKPYVADERDPGKLIELKADMFDVNCFVYSKRHRVAMYTTNSRGPSQQEFCAYLNSYLPKEDGHTLKMCPVIFEKSLEDIRRSKRVTSILVSVDLGEDINYYFREQIEENRGLTATLLSLMNTSKEIVDGRYLTFNIGLGKTKKTETLNKESVLSLLGKLNLDSRFIKQIELKYEDQRTEKIETYKIKGTDTFLRGAFSTRNSNLAPEFLLENAGDVYLRQRDYFIEDVEEFINGIKQGKSEDYELNLDWREDE